MRLRTVCVGTAIWLAAPAVAAAQPRDALRLTLEEAVVRAVETSRRLADLRARREAADAEVAVRGADDRPAVALQAGYQRTNHIEPFGVFLPDGRFREIFPDIPNNYRARLDLQWPIFTGGRAGALERAARADAAASAGEAATAQSDLGLEVARAYWALVTAGETERVVQASLDRARAHLSDMRARFQAGLVPPNEVFSIEAHESRRRAALIEARARRGIARLALNRLIGAAPGTAVEAVESLAPPSPVPQDEAALVREAHAGRADRQALASQVDAAAARREAAGAGLLPAVVVTGGVDYARPNNRFLPRRADWRESWDAGITVQWPLWDGGRTRALAAQAEARREAARQRLEDFDLAIDLQVRQRRLALEASAAAIAAAEDAIRSAAEARRVVGERFAAGVATSTEELDAQVALLEAELDRTRALADARLAEAELARALGR